MRPEDPQAASHPIPAPDGKDALVDLLRLERVDRDLFRANLVFPDPFALYGGQVAAQALRAAGLTVADDRPPHSLHGYFLRPGDASHPTVFQVFRDRDGRSFSARRVVALQNGKVIFNMSASFHVTEEGADGQVPRMPEVTAPEAGPVLRLPRVFSFESREVAQPYPDTEWPTRFWARSTADLGADPLLNACALTYVSDISSGTVPFNSATHSVGSSLDHAVWFHRPALMTDWLLIDMVPHVIAGGRGWYTGSLFRTDGTLVASLTQEALFRERR